MEIVLLRHGKPLIDAKVRLPGAEFGLWVGQYDRAGLDPSSFPTAGAVQVARDCTHVVCSNLARARASVDLLGVAAHTCDPLFRECEMPWTAWRFPRLSPVGWSVLLRLMWVLGYSAHSESAAAARERADQCTRRLAELAAEHGKVLYVGHGTMNWLIARRLKRLGWAGPSAPRKHWEHAVYRRG